MIKINLQFFGGRGAASAGGGGGFTGAGYGGTAQSLGLAGQTYIDGNKVSVDGTLNYWEGKSKDLKHEELLMIGEDGFATGYFKGGATSVGFTIPDGVDPAKTVLTHNHPYGGKDGRTIGGSFSNADLNNHINLGFKETRATSTEGTYSFKAAKGVKQNPKGFQKALAGRSAEVSKKADARYKAAQKKGGKAAQKSYIDTYLEESHKWYSKNCSKYGYDYSFTKAKKTK